MRYVCGVYMCFQSGKDRQTTVQTSRQTGYIFGTNRVSQPMDALDLLGLLDQFGDDLTSVVDLTDGNNRAIHWDLEEFLVV
jgi:hypothetical protein